MAERRDLNPRTFVGYTLSKRARQARLRDLSMTGGEIIPYFAQEVTLWAR